MYEGKGKILQLCFDSGAIVDRPLAIASNRCRARNPECDKVLEPYVPQISKEQDPEFDSNGRFTPEHVGTWFGDIDW